jgi:hypothetical protein
MEAVNTKFIEGSDFDFVIQRTQDVEPIIEHAKALHNEGFHGSSDMKHAAEIPLVLVEDYMNRNKISWHEFSNSQDHIKRMLQDPAMGHFRIWKGAV